MAPVVRRRLEGKLADPQFGIGCEPRVYAASRPVDMAFLSGRQVMYRASPTLTE